MPVAATVREVRCAPVRQADAQMVRFVRAGFEQVICSVSVIVKQTENRNGSLASPVQKVPAHTGNHRSLYVNWIKLVFSSKDMSHETN
jgi:hypothetical protein